MKKIFKTVVVLFVVAGCSVKQKDKKNANTVEAVSIQAQEDEQFTLFWKPLMPNQYELNIKVSKEMSSQALLIGKEVNNRSHLEQMVLDQESFWRDSNFKAHDKIKYQIFSSQHELLKTYIVEVPEDLVVSGNYQIQTQSANSMEKIELIYERIYLDKNSIFTTNGQNILLKAKEIISDDGLMQTFPESQTASVGQDGRSGGLVEIQAEAIVGKLVFLMRGENGGVGFSGASADLSMKGSKGVPGATANYRCIKYQDNNIYGRCLMEECSAPASNGGAGFKGLPGKIGGVGHNGGDTGVLKIQINDKSRMSLQIERIVGRRGLGGDGGAGGEGGDGGEPGYPSTCAPAARGSQGAQGDRGQRGADGYDGQLGKICESFEGKPEFCY